MVEMPYLAHASPELCRSALGDAPGKKQNNPQPHIALQLLHCCLVAAGAEVPAPAAADLFVGCPGSPQHQCVCESLWHAQRQRSSVPWSAASRAALPVRTGIEQDTS